MSLKRSPSTWPATVLPDQRTPTFYLTPRDRNVCGHQNFGIPFFQSLDPSLKNQWLKRKQLDAHNRIYRQWGMTVTGKCSLATIVVNSGYMYFRYIDHHTSLKHMSSLEEVQSQDIHVQFIVSTNSSAHIIVAGTVPWVTTNVWLGLSFATATNYGVVKT